VFVEADKTAKVVKKLECNIKLPDEWYKADNLTAINRILDDSKPRLKLFE
jgi:hypothetical protein